MIRKDSSAFSFTAENCFDRVVLVMKIQNGLDHVRECAVADVVQKSGNKYGGIFVFGYRVLCAKPFEDPRCEMIGPETVREP